MYQVKQEREPEVVDVEIVEKRSEPVVPPMSDEMQKLLTEAKQIGRSNTVAYTLGFVVMVVVWVAQMRSCGMIG